MSSDDPYEGLYRVVILTSSAFEFGAFHGGCFVDPAWPSVDFGRSKHGPVSSFNCGAPLNFALDVMEY